MSNTPRNQAPSELPSQNIFANLIGGPDLHVPDWLIHKHIRANGLKIKGLGHYQLYVDFILEKSAGRINRPQWHSRKTLTEIMQLSGNNLSRYEPSWIADGWLLKDESGGRGSSHRALGRQFDHIRIKSYNTPQSGGGYKPNQIHFESSYKSNQIHFESSDQIHIESPNPNNLNPNLSLSSNEEREREQKAKEALPFDEGAPQEEKKLRKVEQNPYWLSDAIGRPRPRPK
jgi:hypothetical protein